MAASRAETRTGGRPATTGTIWGNLALSVGMPDKPAPEGWRWTRLTDVARLETGHTPSRKRPEYWEGEIPWIGIKDATGNHGRKIHDTIQHTNQLGIANSSARILPENTVCLSRTASVGYVVVMGRPMATSQDFVNWVCSENLDSQFLKYVLLGERSAFLRFASGTTHQTVYFPEVKAFHVCLPPLPEQRAIAHILGTLDDKIDLNRRMNETLEAMARALFKSWFVDFDPVRAKMEGGDPGLPKHIADLFPDRLVESELGEIPEGWRIRPLAEMAMVVDCLHSRKPERQKDGPVLIQVFNIGPTGRLDFSDSYNVTEDDYAEWTRRMEVFPGDLVVTKTGRVGAVGQMPKGYKAAMGRNMVGIRAILDRSLPRFLKDSLLSDRMCREMMRNTNDGTILRSLHVKAISQLQEVLPSYDIVSSYEALIAPVHAKLEQNDVQSKTLATMRDALLPKLVSGEIPLHAAERAVENVQ